MTDESAEVESEETPTRVRVVLILRMGRNILAGPASPSTPDLLLPSHELRAGQSVAASAKAIAADVLDRGLGRGALRGLCLVSAEDDEADVVELCVAATIDEAARDEALVVKAPWAFHPEFESTWSAGAARALAFPAGAFTAIDLDGAALPIGGVAAAPVLREDEPLLLPRAPSPSREAFVLGVAITGGVASASSTIWALALANFLKPELALVLWVLALVGLFGAAAHGRPGRRVAIAGVLVLPMGFVLFVLSMMVGGADEAHLAFWLWALGSASLALALRRLGRATERTEQQRVRRRMAWAAAGLVSLVAVFPPLRDAIFKRGATTASDDESAPTSRAPEDD